MAQEQPGEIIQVLADPAGTAQDSSNQAAEGGDLSAELLLVVAALRSRDPAKRLAAARALQRIGAPAVPILLAALDEETEPARREPSIKALGMIGPAARAALSRLEPLCEDEAVGPAARDAVRSIRGGWLPDWKRVAEFGLPWAIAVLTLATVINEISSWLGLLGSLEGLALQIALVWAFLGAVLGGFFGANCGSAWVAKKGAQYLAVAGACFGAALGRWAGTLIEPLVQALSR